MRQAGIIAAAGLYAFEHNVERMAEDHENARLLERGFNAIPRVRTVMGPVETNIVLFDVSATGLSATEIEAGLEQRGVRMSPYSNSGSLIRAVTHLDVSRFDCERAVEALQGVISEA
jgi:threonine aldolase